MLFTTFFFANLHSSKSALQQICIPANPHFSKSALQQIRTSENLHFSKPTLQQIHVPALLHGIGMRLFSSSYFIGATPIPDLYTCTYAI